MSLKWILCALILPQIKHVDIRLRRLTSIGPAGRRSPPMERDVGLGWRVIESQINKIFSAYSFSIFTNSVYSCYLLFIESNAEH